MKSPTPQCAQLIADLRRERRTLELTQKQVAEKLHIDRATICRYETLKETPPLEHLITWAAALGHQVALLRTDSTPW